jgi:hypothetical protein
LRDSAPISLRRYYHSFKSLSGLLAGTVAALPLLSRLLPDDGRAYAFPPLGDIEGPARIGTVVLAIAFTYAAYFSRQPKIKMRIRRVSGLVALAALCFLSYLILSVQFVRRIEIPSRGASVFLSVGYDRTEFAIATFGPATDEEMLRQRGPDEEQTRRLWTPKSVAIVRLSLFGSYLGSILALVFAFSVGVVFQLEDSRSD